MPKLMHKHSMSCTCTVYEYVNVVVDIEVTACHIVMLERCWRVTGCGLTLDGTDDHVVKPQGMPAYAPPAPPAPVA